MSTKLIVLAAVLVLAGTTHPGSVIILLRLQPGAGNGHICEIPHLRWSEIYHFVQSKVKMSLAVTEAAQLIPVAHLYML